MKLISFAIVSLLAVTVSAHLPHGAATQDMDQSQGSNTESVQQPQSTSTEEMDQYQSTDTQTLQEHDQDAFQAELEKLEKACEEIEAQISELHNEIEMQEKMMTDFGSEIQGLMIALTKQGISETAKTLLKKQYDSAFSSWKGVLDIMDIKESDLKKAKKERTDTQIQLLTLKENHKRLMEHNANN
ncbi:hypothetical protein BASA50_006922 [Batrachochytrium salamandrivorans]|uniref:Uncharacterized protein n=1 Tax=Batrachochytrium salamandrivorans TaxID=1357716 RepID=A0ABQ8F8F4_9FUNG|nr:hypothetical protein BASA50_006922 [Batrachochytrium salamandrivorans]